MSDIYEEFDRATGGLVAYAISKDDEQVGRVVIKYGSSVRAFCQIWCSRMVKGTARGGGYDRASAAVESAVAKMKADHGDNGAAAHIAAWQGALRGDSGYGWLRRLEDAGYTVQHVLG